ncbi:MAG: hypothetical protein H8K10_15430 [Nitrospira sp.]|nr:hypothetical protein [Nitrospira sp.]
MSLDTITTAIKTVIAGADPVSLVHDYERWANEPDAFKALYIPADQPDEAHYVRAWLIKWMSSAKEPLTHSDEVTLHTFALRFLHSVKDETATEKAAAAIVETVIAAFHNNPTMGLAGSTVQPQIGSGAFQLTPTLDRNEYLQIGQVLCHFFELRLIVQEDR